MLCKRHIYALQKAYLRVVNDIFTYHKKPPRKNHMYSHRRLLLSYNRSNYHLQRLQLPLTTVITATYLMHRKKYVTLHARFHT